jgi:hypothetical protein
MAKGSASDKVKSRKQRNREAQDERERRNRNDAGPTPWERASEARRLHRRQLRAMGGLKTQPRNADGFIIKRDAAGNEILVECCAKCTREARLALMDEADAKLARKAEEAARRRARITSKRADAKPAGRGADSRRKSPAGA